MAWLGLALAFSLLMFAAMPAEQAVRATSDHGGAAWSALRADAPLAGHSAVLTPAGRLVLHGGEREPSRAPEAMRQLDLSGPSEAWSNVQASGDLPMARLDHRGLLGSRAVVDPAEHLLLTVCDCLGGSTFLLDLDDGGWSHAPNDAALPFWFSLLAYDAPRDRAVLYGGQQFGLGDQVTRKGWAYDLSPTRSGWQALPDAPFDLVYQAADVDPRSGHLLAFGGIEAAGALEASLWRLDLAATAAPDAWRDITSLAGSGPPARVGATLTFDPETSLAVLYGGRTGTSDLDDVWLLDYIDPTHPSWSRVDLHDDPGPGARSGHSATWDPATKRTVVYGGTGRDERTGETRYLNDTWALDLNAPEPSPSPTPTSPRVFLPAGYNGIAATDP